MLQTKQNDFREAIKIWPKISASLSVIRNESQYRKAISFLDYLIDAVEANKKHPLADLLDLMGVLVEDYENKHVPEPESDPIACLKFLMAEHGLAQRDLPELGSQGVVSQILSGERALNLRQIKALSNRFQVSPSVFIQE